MIKKAEGLAPGGDLLLTRSKLIADVLHRKVFDKIWPQLSTNLSRWTGAKNFHIILWLRGFFSRCPSREKFGRHGKPCT